MRSLLAILAPVVCLASTAHAIEYSAESVAQNSKGQARTEKIYVSNGKIRVEPVGGSSYELLDVTKQAGYFVLPEKKAYIVQPSKMVAYNSTSYNVGPTPCVALVAFGGKATCNKLGMDKLNGRVVEKWQLVQSTPDSPGGKEPTFTSTVWIDRGLNAVVKAQSARGTFQLQNVRPGPQPAALFALPAGYTAQQPPSVSITPGPAIKN